MIGEPTFGKGLVQSVISFETGEALKLTTAKYFTPSGRLIQKVDYFGDDTTFVISPIEESTDTAFTTRNGRKVEGGGGIEPDIMVETPQPGQLGVELWRKGTFFDFVTQFIAENPGVTDAKVSEQMIDQFRDWLVENDFNYSVDGEKELETLREILTTFNLENDAEADFAHLEHYLELVRDRDFDEERPFIKNSLQTELGNSLYGSTGRIEASFDSDPQILQAVEVLNNNSEYGKLLAVTTDSSQTKGE